MAEPPSLFHRSIAHALSSWPALATCVRMGAGGRESAEKAEWLIGATEQWMTENQGIEPEELAEFYQDVLWNEFDMVVDDGSLIHVSKTICDYQMKIKRGLKSEVESSIREAPRVPQNVSIAVDDDSDDDDDGDGGFSGVPRGSSGGVGDRGAQNSGGSGGSGNAEEEMEVDGEEAKTAEEEEEDGWTTVKTKSGKKRR